MAIYRLEAKIISRGNGHSAVAAAAYRTGTKIRDERADKTHDYSTAREWFHSPGFPAFRGVIFWQDFVQWRTNQNGFASQPEKLPHNNGVSTTAASKLPPRAARILLDA